MGSSRELPFLSTHSSSLITVDRLAGPTSLHPLSLLSEAGMTFPSITRQDHFLHQISLDLETP